MHLITPMTDVTVNQPPLPPILPKQQRKTKISRQLRAAIDAMVWLGLKRDDAAIHAGMKDNSLYVALRRPDVKAAYLAECEVLRTSGRARRIHRLEAMQEQDDNKAAVINAIVALEGIGNDQATANAQQSSSPGVVIQIISHAPVDARLTQTVIEQPKLIEISDG